MEAFPLTLILFLAKFAYGGLESGKERHIIIGMIGAVDTNAELTIMAVGQGKVTFVNPRLAEGYTKGQEAWCAEKCSIEISKPFKGKYENPQDVVNYILNGQDLLTVFVSKSPVSIINMRPNTKDFHTRWVRADGAHKSTVTTTANFDSLSSFGEKLNVIKEPLPTTQTPPPNPPQQRPEIGAQRRQYLLKAASSISLKLSTESVSHLLGLSDPTDE